jgi:hypothetical protein
MRVTKTVNREKFQPDPRFHSDSTIRIDHSMAKVRAVKVSLLFGDDLVGQVVNHDGTLHVDDYWLGTVLIFDERSPVLRI